jgi:phage tail protein X
MTAIVLTIPNDRTPLDLLLWRRFGREVPGLVEAVLADQRNVGIAALGVFPPPGTLVIVEPPAPAAKTNTAVISLYE